MPRYIIIQPATPTSNTQVLDTVEGEPISVIQDLSLFSGPNSEREYERVSNEIVGRLFMIISFMRMTNCQIAEGRRRCISSP